MPTKAHICSDMRLHSGLIFKCPQSRRIFVKPFGLRVIPFGLRHFFLVSYSPCCCGLLILKGNFWPSFLPLVKTTYDRLQSRPLALEHRVLNEVEGHLPFVV